MSAATPPWPPEREARRAVLVLMVAYIFSYIDRQILAMLVGPIKADLGVTDFELSLLNGLAFAVCFTVLGVWPVGQWADRGNRRNLAAAGVFLWSLMTAICGRVTSYAGLFVARVGVGVGEATLAPAAYSMIADYVPPARRGRALGLFSMGVYLGIGVAIMVTGLVVQGVGNLSVMHWPLIGEVRGWQVAFLILGPPGMLVSLWLLSLREPTRRDAGDTAGVRYADVWRRIREEAGFYANLTFGVSMLTLTFNAVAFWVPAHLLRAHELSPLQVAFSYGPIMFVAGSLGILAGGMLADRWRAAGRADAELQVILYSALALAPLVIAAFQVSDAALAIALLAPLLFVTSFPFGAASAALQMVTPNRLRARTSAIYLLVINLLGIGLGSSAASFVSDVLLNDEQRIGDGVTAVAVLAAPLAAALIHRARPTYRRLTLTAAS
ncbi:MAG: MFS transporter [Sinobacteraceae bacterium]|nr:MFS transporter [Nevskiaceae bacterium]